MVKFSKINRTIVQKNREKSRQSIQLLNIDENTRKILRVILFNPRLSYREIARMTKLSVATVSEKIRKLMTDGIIKGFHTDVDAKKLGYGLTAVIEVIASKGEFTEAAKEISKFPNVYAVYSISGPYDVTIVAKFRSSDELSEFLKKLNKKPSVVRTETHVVLRTIKEDFRVRV